MDEVRDEQKLFKIRQQIQQNMILPDPGIQYQLYRAWEDSANYEDGHNEWYYVDITDNIQRIFRGMLDASRGILYLDSRSILGMVQERIDSALAAFNAGHWPYKGL